MHGCRVRAVSTSAAVHVVVTPPTRTRHGRRYGATSAGPCRMRVRATCRDPHPRGAPGRTTHRRRLPVGRCVLGRAHNRRFPDVRRRARQRVPSTDTARGAVGDPVRRAHRGATGRGRGRRQRDGGGARSVAGRGALLHTAEPVLSVGRARRRRLGSLRRDPTGLGARPGHLRLGPRGSGVRIRLEPADRDRARRAHDPRRGVPRLRAPRCGVVPRAQHPGALRRSAISPTSAFRRPTRRWTSAPGWRCTSATVGGRSILATGPAGWDGCSSGVDGTRSMSPWCRRSAPSSSNRWSCGPTRSPAERNRPEQERAACTRTTTLRGRSSTTRGPARRPRRSGPRAARPPPWPGAGCARAPARPTRPPRRRPSPRRRGAPPRTHAPRRRSPRPRRGTEQDRPQRRDTRPDRHHRLGLEPDRFDGIRGLPHPPGQWPLRQRHRCIVARQPHVDHVAQEPGLRAERGEHRLARHPRLGGHVVHRGGRIAALEEQVVGGFPDPRPGGPRLIGPERRAVPPRGRRRHLLDSQSVRMTMSTG